jgi:glycosyltransferase involved in cell wall biosynthesis
MVARPNNPTVTAPSKGACLMVANYAPDVGYAWWLMEHYWVLLAEQLAGQGRRAVLAYPAKGEIPPAIRAAPIDLLWLDFGDRSRAGWRALSETVRREGVTSLYLTDRAYADLRYARLRRLGVHSIAVHDHTPGDRPAIRGPKGWIKSGLRCFGPWSADIYVAVSDFVRQRMVENARLPVGSTVVVPNGVVPFEYSGTDRAWARQHLNVREDDVVVGMVSRAHRIKGIEFAIKAARVVLTREPRALFVFVGDGPDLDRFRALAAEEGVAKRFKFLGRRGDARRLMAGFDVGLHPSLGEVGYCLAILEMMNAGLPVIVPDRPSVRGATERNVTGLWYPANEAGDCAEAILALVSDPSRRESLGRAAREQSLTRFSLEHADSAFLAAVVSRL